MEGHTGGEDPDHPGRAEALPAFVDGSFVTCKEEPGDIDLLLVLPGDYDFSLMVRPMEYNVRSAKQVRRRHQFDILVAREDSAEYHEFRDWFHQVKGEPNGRKGYLRLRL